MKTTGIACISSFALALAFLSSPVSAATWGSGNGDLTVAVAGQGDLKIEAFGKPPHAGPPGGLPPGPPDVVPPVDKPDKSPKNPNDGKDGDPDDGNAGKGNDDKTLPNDGPAND